MGILVTGGAGFIGSNLVEDLLASGQTVTVLDNMSTGSMDNLKGLEGSLEIIKGSCMDLPRRDLHPEWIFHLGIASSSPMYKKDPMLVGNAVNEAIAVLELAKREGARVVYASTSSLYNGLLPPHREDMPIGVTDYYTEARLAIERVAELYHRLFNVSSVGMRFFSVYGPHEEAKKQYANMISQFIWELAAGRTPVVYGDGSQTRDFTYVKDVVRALRMAMDSDCQGVLNVGTGSTFSFNQLLELLNEKMGTEIAPEYVENPLKNYVQSTLADTSRAEKVIGFKAKYGLAEGIDELLRYYGGSTR